MKKPKRTHVSDTTEIVTFRLEHELIARLRDVKEKTGVPVSQLVKRAVKHWLDLGQFGDYVVVEAKASTRRQ